VWWWRLGLKWSQLSLKLNSSLGAHLSPVLPNLLPSLTCELSCLDLSACAVTWAEDSAGMYLLTPLAKSGELECCSGVAYGMGDGLDGGTMI